MRNLREFPVTMGDVMNTLDHALQQEDDDDRVGGLDALILRRIYELAPEVFNEDMFIDVD